MVQRTAHANKLYITRCPKLWSLSLPPTLASLNISECPILKERCLKEKGEHWPNIADFPNNGKQNPVQPYPHIIQSASLTSVGCKFRWVLLDGDVAVSSQSELVGVEYPVVVAFSDEEFLLLAPINFDRSP
ncbi:hypothetical protein CK203_054379 [Vitis vinifera]|uniref:Disease resistance protein n=1 Tax=Vitis vinifera TaxID=29760 RepID=A0A438GG95_VITVI|nr:hypothetical protein CK203_054379 [Vitis vinifera]